MKIAAIICAVALFAHAGSADARWKPEFANAPAEVRDWYETRELTPAAQMRFGFRSCCSHSDVVKTRFKVGGAGNDEWYWLNPATNTFERVPEDIIHWDQHAPNGQPVLFAVGGRPTCFFPPEGGL